MKKNIAIFCIIFWAGLIAGISFLEAPLKFQAPGITIPLGLGIGKLVFQALNKIEVALLATILFCTFSPKIDNLSRTLLVILVFLMVADTLWLLPLLDKRATLLLTGNPAPESHHHILYIIIEIIKFLSLVALGFTQLNKLSYENRYRK